MFFDVFFSEELKNDSIYFQKLILNVTTILFRRMVSVIYCIALACVANSRQIIFIGYISGKAFRCQAEFSAKALIGKFRLRESVGRIVEIKNDIENILKNICVTQEDFAKNFVLKKNFVITLSVRE